MFRKESLADKRNFKRSVFSDFSVLEQSLQPHCLLFYILRKREEAVRNFEYLKLQKGKILSVLMPTQVSH